MDSKEFSASFGGTDGKTKGKGKDYDAKLDETFHSSITY